MKSKGFTYLLLIVVAIVWYNVFFRIKSNLMGEDILISQNNTQVSVLKTHVRDTFTLNANYRDPFEGFSEKVENNATQTAQSIVTPPVYIAPKPVRIFQWPKVKYYGLLKNNTAKKALCIMNFDDMLFNLYEGEYFLDGYFVKGIYRDSIIIQNKKEKKTFYKITK